ncbi:MAG: LPS export ABC transporter permease LptF [Magnetococcales bacterium]|nr:LPS export ABC transporter permease LptF [Magnetococcales bacterium]
MNRLSRYLFTDCAQTSLLALGTLTFLVMLPQVLLLVDLWVNKGASLQVLRKLILLAIPQFMVGALPMALLSGILLAMGRMAQDNELIVIKASGISILQLTRPIGLLVVIFTVFSLLLNWLWVPQAFYEFSVLKKSLLTSNTALAVQQKTFNRDVPGLTIYVDHQDPKSGTLEGILIHDQRNPDEVVTITAQRAHPHTGKDNKAALYLEEGSRHWVTRGGHYRHMQFATFNLELELVLGLIPRHKKEELEEMGPWELYDVIHNGPPESNLAARMEWHRRLAFPVATLIMGLLAIPLGMQHTHRAARGYGFIAALSILILHFLLLAAGEALAGRKILSPLAGFWLPNLFMAILTVDVFLLTLRGRAVFGIGWLLAIVQFPRRLLAPRGHE